MQMTKGRLFLPNVEESTHTRRCLKKEPVKKDDPRETQSDGKSSGSITDDYSHRESRDAMSAHSFST